MTLLELLAVIATGGGTLGAGAGTAWAAMRSTRRPPASEPRRTAAPSDPQPHVPRSTQLGTWSGTTGPQPSIDQLCPEHSAMVQRHAASESRLGRIEAKQDVMLSDLSEMRGALGLGDRVHRGGAAAGGGR